MTKTFHTPSLIAKKRDGQVMTDDEIHYLVEGFTKGDIPDYQLAAWAMAVYLQGMNEHEATALTLAMAKSGQTVEFPGIQGTIVDKHSTGGVGDKVSLVLTPLVAAAGMNVAKLSGRGLGHTGGTIDKLESIPGFQAALSIEEMIEQVNQMGIALSESTHDLAPADKALYGLRDVTATVGSLPLIASSIMSKKLAVDTHAIVLDVKVGSGALMKNLEQAGELAKLMVQIGNGAGRKTSALLTNMDQPLGFAVGHAVEVKEAIETLKGNGPEDLTELCLSLSAQLLSLTQPDVNADAAKAKLKQYLEDGSAFEKFKVWIETQHGDASYADDLSKFPATAETVTVASPSSGYVQSLDALSIGQAAHSLGAGRTKKGESIDHAVGVVLHAKISDQVNEGDALATLYVNKTDNLESAKQQIEGAFQFSTDPVGKPTLIHETITA